MKSDMAVENLGHQRIDRAPAGGNRVQDVRALGAALDRVLDGFHLPSNPPDAIQHLLLVSNDVSQKASPLKTIIYPGRYIV